MSACICGHVSHTREVPVRGDDKIGWKCNQCLGIRAMPCARCGVAISYRADPVDPSEKAMDCCHACDVEVLKECWGDERAKVATLTADRDALKVRLARAEERLEVATQLLRNVEGLPFEESNDARGIAAFLAETDAGER